MTETETEGLTSQSGKPAPPSGGGTAICLVFPFIAVLTFHGWWPIHQAHRACGCSERLAEAQLGPARLHHHRRRWHTPRSSLVYSPVRADATSLGGALPGVLRLFAFTQDLSRSRFDSTSRFLCRRTSRATKAAFTSWATRSCRRTPHLRRKMGVAWTTLALGGCATSCTLRRTGPPTKEWRQ